MDVTTVEIFQRIPTPFYYYDMELLETTLRTAVELASHHGYHLHYAMKANSNPRILHTVARHGIGADCVSGNEIRQALSHGIPPQQIVYAGVGKTDEEIALALKEDILCFNCESLPELQVIEHIACQADRTARVALRINPGVDAHTHRYITTGTEENKFGFTFTDLPQAIDICRQSNHLSLMGLHFHVGSQIIDMQPFRLLCDRINKLQVDFHTVDLPYLNVGGGLGIDYQTPERHPVPDFATYFNTSKRFVIIDAGMNDLLRPALYQATHPIENLSSSAPPRRYDVVGPVCESADCFGQDVLLPATRRGDLLAIRSCGAYGESMASRYNLRPLIDSRFSDALPSF